MTSFRIMHTRAGAFKKGQIVTEKQIKDSGADLSFWKSTGAVEEVTILTKTEAEAQHVVPEITDPGAAAREAVEAAQSMALKEQSDAQAAVAAAAAARTRTGQTAAEKAAAEKIAAEKAAADAAASAQQ